MNTTPKDYSNNRVKPSSLPTANINLNAPAGTIEKASGATSGSRTIKLDISGFQKKVESIPLTRFISTEVNHIVDTEVNHIVDTALNQLEDPLTGEFLRKYINEYFENAPKPNTTRQKPAGLLFDIQAALFIVSGEFSYFL